VKSEYGTPGTIIEKKKKQSIHRKTGQDVKERDQLARGKRGKKKTGEKGNQHLMGGPEEFQRVKNPEGWHLMRCHGVGVEGISIQMEGTKETQKKRGEQEGN